MTSSAFRELYFASLDKALVDRRFTERSMALIYAMTSLLNNNKHGDDLLPLIELVSSLHAAVRHKQGEAETIQIDEISMISRLRVELPLANQLLSEAQSLNELFQKLQPHAQSLQMISLLCRSALTLPCSTAKIESCFSTLIRLLRSTASACQHKARAKSSSLN